MIPHHVPVAPAPSEYPTLATANWGPSAGSTSFEFLVKGHMYRLRQTGNITSFVANIGSVTNVTGLQFKVWRKNGGGYDLVGSSDVFTPSANTLQQYVLTTPFAAAQGDYVGVRLTFSSSSGSNFTKSAALRANTAYGATAYDTVNESVYTYYVTNSTPATGHNWEADSYLTNEVVRVQANMDAPDVVFLGDSITSGRFDTYSFADDAQAVYDSAASYPATVSSLQPTFSYQTIARTGRITADLRTEFFQWVAPLLPKYLVIMAGVNDILSGSVSNATIVANMEALVADAVTLGMIPVIVGITPIAPWGSSSFWPRVKEVNDLLEPMVTGAPYNGTFINTEAMGQFYASGDPGNLWQLITGYESVADSVHLSADGQEALGEIVDAAFTFVPRTATGTGLATGGTITTDGDYTLHTFTSSGSFEVTGTMECEILVVGAGGGGGCYWGGGGGGGGVVHATANLATGTYTVTVGSGGAGGDPLGTTHGGSGVDSSFDSISANGGGYGAYAAVGGNGGSGGGGGSAGGSSPVGGSAVGPGLGFGGGTSGSTGQGYPGGGGGGAGSAGANAASAQGGNGGNGVGVSITGTYTFYGGGGGGGIRTGTGGSGGLGGGASAGNGGVGFTPGAAGTANTGGGGAGGSGQAADNTQTGGAGGSGVVIVRYASATALTLTLTESISGSDVRSMTTTELLTDTCTLSDVKAITASKFFGESVFFSDGVALVFASQKVHVETIRITSWLTIQRDRRNSEPSQWTGA